MAMPDDIREMPHIRVLADWIVASNPDATLTGTLTAIDAWSYEVLQKLWTEMEATRGW